MKARKPRKSAVLNVSRLRCIATIGRGLALLALIVVLLVTMHGFLVLVRLEAISWILPIGVLAAGLVEWSKTTLKRAGKGGGKQDSPAGRGSSEDQANARRP